MYSLGLHGRDARPASATYSLGLPGYSANHVMYGAEQERWAKQAYSTPPAEIISLEISAVHEGRNKRKGGHGVSFGNICEGKKDIDTQIDVPQLIVLALETVRPNILLLHWDFHGWDEYETWLEKDEEVQKITLTTSTKSSNAATESTRTVVTSSGSTLLHQPLFNPPLAESSNTATSSKAPSFKRIFERDSTPASLPW
ncbi:hypothetical protein BDR03DRAFT_979642 [Suillus americanus]|nr:hypothetical protein BDR03DRAFT_979642 [Suillus americanus]